MAIQYSNKLTIGHDGHKSHYDVYELAKYALKNELKSHKYIKNPKIFWDKSVINKLNGFIKIDYTDFLNNKASLKKALESIYKYGAVIICGVPKDAKQMINICKPIGSIQPTVFGDNFCLVNSKGNESEFSDRAYTNMSLKGNKYVFLILYFLFYIFYFIFTLKAHTDNSYLKNNSG